MDRLKELDKVVEMLDGQAIHKKNVWIIMDKTRKLIVKGRPTYKYLCMVDDVKDRKRVTIYNSEGATTRAIFNSTLSIEQGVREYLGNKYGHDTKLNQCLEAVRAKLVIKI